MSDRKDRHSGVSRDPKKSGHAGKGGWGVPGTLEEATVEPIDVFDEEESKDVVFTVATVDDPYPPIIRNFFESADIQDLQKTLEESSEVLSYPRFVKKCVQMAMERNAFERELVCKMFSELYWTIIPSGVLAEGFTLLLDQIDDISIDVPNGVDMLGKFIARAVIDDLIPPSFILDSKITSSKTEEALTMADALLKEPHAGKNLQHIWGAGDMTSVNRLVNEVDSIFSDYVSSGDVGDCSESIRQLNARAFLAHLVEEILRVSMERRQTKEAVTLLCELVKVGTLSPDHIIQGFKLCKETQSELAIDIPTVETDLTEMHREVRNNQVIAKDAI